MSENSGFFNAQLVDGEPDRAYEASHFAAYYATLIDNGVFANPATNLQVVAGANALEVIVKAGKAFIQGYWYTNTENLSLSFSPNSGTGQVRWDEVILELNLSTRQIAAKVVTGTLSGTRPTPTVIRSGNVYQLCLAQLKIPPTGSPKLSNSYIYDIRSNSTYCGWVKGLIDQIDTTDLFNQYDASFTEFMDDVEYKLSDSTAGKLQFQIDDIREENACYVALDFPADSTSSRAVVESYRSESAGRYVSTYKDFSFAGAQNVSVQGSGVTVVNSQSSTTLTFTEVGTYRINLQLDGTLTTYLDGQLHSNIGLYLRDTTNDIDFVTYISNVSGESLHDGTYSYNNSSGFSTGVWYNKEAIIEVTSGMLNKALKLIFSTFVLNSSAATINITQIPGIYLTVERVKKESPIPQNLIGVVRLSQAEYDALEEAGELDLETTLYFAVDESGKITMYYGGAIMSGGSEPVGVGIAQSSGVTTAITGPGNVAE